MYERPEVLVIMTDEEDIIRTSEEGLENIVIGGGPDEGESIDWGTGF